MRSPLEEFGKFCSGRGVNCVDGRATNDLREFGMHLRDRARDPDGIQAATAQTYYKYVRAFLSFCVRDELLSTNPAKANRATEFLPEDKGDRKRQFWSKSQCQRIVNYATKRVDMALEETIDVSRETAYRDRTIVVLLAEVGVRGAELFRDGNDDYRNGLTWGDVDLESGQIEVFGKSRQREPVGLTQAAYNALERYQRVLKPPTADWPVFPTDHTPSKYRAVQDATGERPEPGSDIDALCREKAIAPPSITKEAGRQIMKQLTEEARIEVENGEYLQPHGARRALGAELYEKGHSELAQSALRHKSIETTHEAYSDIQATDVAESIDKVRK